jgi:alpha-N-arabinofuranosidase
MAFYEAIHAKYPDLTTILSTWDHLPEHIPPGVWIDYHTYTNPDGLVGQFDLFDNVGRDVPYYVGEYSCFLLNDGYWLPQPVMQSSVSEAVFLIGTERNGDIVRMASYGPLMGRTNATQWTVSRDPKVVE